MDEKMRVMTERPLNAETPIERLRSWITDNEVFFKRNQGQFMEEPISLSEWELKLEGLVEKERAFTFDEIRRLPKVEIANTLECSGNSRSLLQKKASGNPWTIGGVGNAMWGGVWLRDVLENTGVQENARHVAFEGLDNPLGSKGIKFIRSIPVEKALASTMLAYEMNGEPIPLKHGYPLRVLALGWTGASCVKWVHRIMVLEQPYEGFFMDRVYRVFQKGEDPKTGEVVTEIVVKSIILEPLLDETKPRGVVAVRGAAYAGEAGIAKVEISIDQGKNWIEARFIGPKEPFAWRHWEYLWDAEEPGDYLIMARATDNKGCPQPDEANWNALGYGNNGVREHAVRITIA